MLHALDISGIMPSKIFVLFNERSHGRDPRLMLETLEPSLQGLFNFWKSFVVTLQGVTAGTYRIFYFAQSSACNAAGCWRVVRWSGHLGRMSQAAGYFFCFLN
jgi:hypothetical protein